MIGKLHIKNKKKIFACCDENLLNTSLKYNDVDIKISSSFYGKDIITKEKLLENIKNCNQANIFGEKVCNILIENNIIKKEQILYINKVPHIQIYKI